MSNFIPTSTLGTMLDRKSLKTDTFSKLGIGAIQNGKRKWPKTRTASWRTSYHFETCVKKLDCKKTVHTRLFLRLKSRELKQVDARQTGGLGRLGQIKDQNKTKTRTVNPDIERKTEEHEGASTKSKEAHHCIYIPMTRKQNDKWTIAGEMTNRQWMKRRACTNCSKRSHQDSNFNSCVRTVGTIHHTRTWSSETTDEILMTSKLNTASWWAWFEKGP